MNGDREHFRDIPLSEYKRRYDDTHNRITMAELENGLVAEAYSTNALLEQRDLAVNFTVQIESVNRSNEEVFGFVTLKLIVYSGGLLQPLTGVFRMAQAYPDPLLRQRPAAPVEWDLTHDRPLHTPYHRQIRRGFLAAWTDNDLTDLDHFTATIPDESVVRPPRSQQRSHPLIPTDRE